MPQKKRGGGGSTEDGDRSEQAEVVAPKRQRVSLACDACRVARERCDGERPQCGTCVSQRRACSYTPTAKKRGVQTGYLRTIEMSLAWILYEEAPTTEEALLRLLQDKSGPLHKKGKAADKLHKKWTKSRVNKEIGLLLSGSATQPSRDDSSDNETDTEGNGEGMSSNFDVQDQLHNSASPFLQRERTEVPRASLLKLPRNWRRLFDIYFTYTHCWFPILNRDRILETALAYPPEGIPGPSSVMDVAPSYAELWAVLSLASFQDTTSSNPMQGSMSPKQIYATARGLIPSEERQFELPHLRALLLHSLVLIGQGADLAAWMLVGTATRLAMFLRGTGALYSDGLGINETTERSGRIALAACFVLDTIAATGLGQPASTHVGPANVDAEALATPAADENWSPLVGFGPTQPEHSQPGPHVQPLRTFQQLLRFCQVLRRGLDPTSLQSRQTTNAAESMAEVLDPVYSFCNSVIFGASTPPVPSAFLLQIAFLAMTTRLFQSFRGSLLSSLTEAVEGCISSFGSCGTPPLVVGLMGIVQRCAHLGKMHEAERTKWHTTLESLKAVWRNDDVQPSGLPPASDFEVEYSDAGHMATSRQLPTRLNNHQAHIPGYSFSQQPNMGPDSHGFQVVHPIESPSTVQSQAITSPSGPFPSSASMRGSGAPAGMFSGVTGVDLHTQGVDYDAILEELGSIDCTDGLDMDPQFMTNLGFAPGCDLGDMLQGEFGG